MRLGSCLPRRRSPRRSKAGRPCTVISSGARNLPIEAWIAQQNQRDQRAYVRCLTSFGMTAGKIVCLTAVSSIAIVANCLGAGSAAGFNYNRDTLSFANTTVFEYHNGEVVSRWSRKSDRYTRRCFVMTRTVEQFYKFARFDHAKPALAQSIATGKAGRFPWLSESPRDESDKHQIDAEKHRPWLGRLSPARKCPDVLSPQQKLSGQNS